MTPRMSSFFFFIILIAAVVGTAFIFMPFLTPLILAMAATVIAYPLYVRICEYIGRSNLKDSISSAITVIFVLLIIVVPTLFLISRIYGEVQSLYGLLIDESNRGQVIKALSSIWDTITKVTFNVLPQHSFESFNITNSLKSGLEWIFGNLDNVFSSLAMVGGYALIFLLAMFYFLRDGRSFRDLVLSWSPLLSENKVYISSTFKRAIMSVFAGTLAVAVIEGISTGLAFLVVGIPAPALWGTVAAVAALVPGFGVSLIIIPAVIYLILSGEYTYAVLLFVWGYSAIFFVDHILGPSLINRGLKIHPFLVLISVLGGLLTFGIIGFVMGPLVLVVLFTLLEIYKNSYGKEAITTSPDINA